MMLSVSVLKGAALRGFMAGIAVLLLCRGVEACCVEAGEIETGEVEGQGVAH